MLKEIKTQKDKVKALLRDYPETRSCDKLLWLGFMRLYGGFADLSELDYRRVRKIILEAAPFESIRRCRQKLQEHNPELSATDIVKEFRGKEQKDISDYFGGK